MVFLVSPRPSDCRLERFQRFLQFLILDMSVDLGRGDVFVSQRFLHRQKVFSAGIKVGCEGMPQDMRSNSFVNASLLRPHLQPKGKLPV